MALLWLFFRPDTSEHGHILGPDNRVVSTLLGQPNFLP
jgi:hypothetical protein